MKYTKEQLWERFQKFYFDFPEIDLSIDLSRMWVDEAFFTELEPKLQEAYSSMATLEAGAIANPDENRMVGHYWLRTPELAPTKEIQLAIEENIEKIQIFAEKIHNGTIQGSGGRFKNYILIGIGGSALGPQFLAHALGHSKKDKIKPFFIDNTDPDGVERVLSGISDELDQTLCIVTSKSGGTKETRNGMLLVKRAYELKEIDFSKHVVAITMQESDLDKLAVEQNWICRFPMWDWVGGRTSEFSSVGLLPAALQGFNILNLLSGARKIDSITREVITKKNPAALLAATWFYSGNGRGNKNMIVLPYKDQLEIFSKYLQQLLMESLGKALDKDGNVVNQGLSVFGNKGATDQHSYIQQLRDGRNDFFASFVEVINCNLKNDLEVEPSVSAADYLSGFYIGTREALTDGGRESVSITIQLVSEASIGCLVALFERAVGFYASLININAYHQPGVEYGKKAATQVIELKKQIVEFIKINREKSFSAEQIAREIRKGESSEWVFKICLRLSCMQNSKIKVLKNGTPKEYAFFSV